MSGVVLRCPHCGTRNAATGECTTCHEAAVRYQCTNHTPARWLEGPGCGDCGARFGVAAPAAPSARPAAPAPRPTAPAARPAAPVRPGTEPWGRSADASAPDAAAAGAERVQARLRELLLATARGRRRPAAPTAGEEPESRAPRRGGCLLQLLMLLLVLFLLTFIGPLLFGLSMLQMLRF